MVDYVTFCIYQSYTFKKSSLRFLYYLLSYVVLLVSSDGEESLSSSTDSSSEEEVVEKDKEEREVHVGIGSPTMDAYVSRIVSNYEDTFDSM